MNNPIWINGKLQERFFTEFNRQSVAEGDYPYEVRRRREGRGSILVLKCASESMANEECERFNKHHSDDIEVPKF